MKKRLLTLLSLIMAFVLCFSLVACGGSDKSKKPNKPNTPSDDDDKKPTGTEVSISIDDLLDVVNGVVYADGLTGTASYMLSTKNTGTLSDSVAIDKRGNKVKMDDVIFDLETGDCYVKGENGYTFNQYWYGGIFDYLLGLVNEFVGGSADKEITVIYDKDEKTVTYTYDAAQNVNKFLTPLYNAYNGKTINDMLNDYCNLLFGKSFDSMYSQISAYIVDENNTVGDVLDMLKEGMGVDLLELLGENGLPLDEEDVAAVKERKLAEVVAGVYAYIENVLADLMPALPFTVEDDADDGDYDGPSNEEVVMGALFQMLDYMFFAEVSTDNVAQQLDGLKFALNYSAKAFVDMALKDDARLAELYTAIKNGVKFKDLYFTVALKVDSDKAVKGVKVDFLAAHTYTGNTTGYMFLSDNDYFASAELAIDAYTTDANDFDITFDPECDYRHFVNKYLYNLPDTNTMLYYETAGNEMAYDAIYIYDTNYEPITDAPNNAVMFVDNASSFVFDSAFLKSVFEGQPVGTRLYVAIHFADEEWITLVLTYVVGDPGDVLEFLFLSMLGF